MKKQAVWQIRIAFEVYELPRVRDISLYTVPTPENGPPQNRGEKEVHIGYIQDRFRTSQKSTQPLALHFGFTSTIMANDLF